MGRLPRARKFADLFDHHAGLAAGAAERILRAWLPMLPRAAFVSALAWWLAQRHP